MNMKKIINSVIIVASLLSAASCLKEDVNPSTGTPNPVASLQIVRAVYKDADVQLGPQVLTGAYLTGGVVISDAATHNLPTGQVVVQSTWRGLIRGLVLQMDASMAAGFAVGDSLRIDLTGATITSIDEALAVTGLTAQNVTKISSGNETTIRTISIGRFNERFEEYESTLVSITANVSPFPQDGETLSGNKTLDDGTGNTTMLFTQEDATFSGEKIAPSAGFQGIAYRSGTNRQLRMRSLSDMTFPSGPIYAGYPETFESPDATVKGSYNMPAINNDIDLVTGNWKLEQAILGPTVNRDRIVSGKQAIRMQQNLAVPGYLQMNYDVPNGAAKVTFWYGSYYEDVSSSLQLEYSTDGGTTWEKIGEVITDPHRYSESSSAKLATYSMDIDGPVRFRIHKLGLGPSSGTTVQNGRLGIDDFSIYQNY
jgi:hypothetical protein